MFEIQNCRKVPCKNAIENICTCTHTYFNATLFTHIHTHTHTHTHSHTLTVHALQLQAIEPVLPTFLSQE